MGFFSSGNGEARCQLRRQAFHPGNVVEGFVDLIISKPVQIVAIHLKVTGKEKIEGGGDDQFVRESIPFYKELVTLVGQMKNSGSRSEVTIPSGRYCYPFAFQLPLTIPPSVTKRAGGFAADVLYHVKIVVETSKGSELGDRQYFTVIQAAPQSQWASRSPVQADRSWPITRFCCIDKGLITGRLHVDRTFLALDRDTIVVVADLDNTKGQEPIESLEVSLWSHCTFRTPGIGSMNETVPEGTFFMKQTIQPGTTGRIAGAIPLSQSLTPSLVTWNIACSYSISVELNIPRASDPKHTFPVTLVQSIDESSVLPRVSWTSNPYTSFSNTKPVGCYYSPPAIPCVAPKLIPVVAPSGATLWNPRIDPRCQLPSVQWAHFVATTAAVRSESDPSIQWMGGVAQCEAKAVPILTAALPMTHSNSGRRTAHVPSLQQNLPRSRVTSAHRPTTHTPLLLPGTSDSTSIGGTCLACGDEAMEPCSSSFTEEAQGK